MVHDAHIYIWAIVRRLYGSWEVQPVSIEFRRMACLFYDAWIQIHGKGATMPHRTLTIRIAIVLLFGIDIARCFADIETH